MYESFFGLDQRPFASVPQVESYYPAATVEAARQTLTRCIRRGEGAGMVVGPSGTGKTLLFRILAEQSPRSLPAVLLSCGRLSTRRTLLQAILHGLGQPYRGMDEGELRLALVDYLSAPEECPDGILLLVDEAHTLPLRLLDEIRMLTNLVAGGKPRIRLVLAGGTILEERFASPKLESFSQRLAARCYLEAFNLSETEGYIRAELTRVGRRGPGLFPPEACHAVYRATDGVPRLVNQVCDHALVLAFAAGKPAIEPATIEEAWADLQQLPTPWSSEEKGPKSGGVVEFGSVVDDAALSESGSAPGEPPTAPPEAAEAASPPSAPADVPAAELPDETPGEMSRLDRVENLISELNDDFQPAGAIRPEVELIFDDPNGPFGGRFEEEEIVVDRCATTVGRQRVEEGEPGCQGEPSHGPFYRLGSASARVRPMRRLLLREAFGAGPDEIVVEDDYEREELPARCVPAVGRHEYRQLFTRLRRGR